MPPRSFAFAGSDLVYTYRDLRESSDREPEGHENGDNYRRDLEQRGYAYRKDQEQRDKNACDQKHGAGDAERERDYRERTEILLVPVLLRVRNGGNADNKAGDGDPEEADRDYSERVDLSPPVGLFDRLLNDGLLRRSILRRFLGAFLSRDDFGLDRLVVIRIAHRLPPVIKIQSAAVPQYQNRVIT